MADVVTLEGNPFTPEIAAEETPILHRPSDMLRAIADGMDKGEHDNVSVGVLVLMGKELSIFGLGKDAIAINTVGLLHTAAHKIEKALLE
jgi:hypothetical protein